MQTSKPLEGRRILVVEDEALIAMMIEDALSEAGAIVVGPIARLPEALAALDSDPRIDAALMDLNLAGISALPIADGLAQREIPFVILTGYGPSGVPAHHNTRTVLNKPFSERHLVEAVVAMLNAAAQSLS